MKKTGIKLASVGLAAGLVVAAAGPGYAATVVAQSSATALSLSIAGSGFDSGTYTATDDGSGEQVTGESNPPIDVLNSQNLVDIGVLAQEASTAIVGKDGTSKACSGVAGQGGAVGQIGESGCLTPGDSFGVNFANLDLSNVVTIDPASALGPLAQLNPVVQMLLGPITKALSNGLAASPLGDLSIGGTFGAVQSACSATPGQASGAANITDAVIGATLAGQSVNLVTLPTHPAPNTEVVTDLDKVLDVVLDGVKTDLLASLNGAAGPLTTLTDAIKTQVVDTVVAQVADQLKPLEDNILRITLNKQTSSGRGQISVTALHAEVLPAAAQFAGSPLVEGDIATVNCGPNARVTGGNPNPGPNPTPTPNPNPNPGPKDPDVPTVIDAGGAASAPWGAGLLALGAISAGTAAGLVTQRRMATARR